MSSSLTFPRSKFTERHFIGDLASLLMRHNLSCGRAEDLEQLGPALDANAGLRSDLFTLCTAISHMSDIDLAPEELLALVSRAVSGQSTPAGEAIEIPSVTRSAFLNGYEAWINRKPGRQAFEPEPMQRTPADVQPAEPVQEPYALPELEVAELVTPYMAQPVMDMVEPTMAVVAAEPEVALPWKPAAAAAAAEPGPTLPLAHVPPHPLGRVAAPNSTRSRVRIRRLQTVNAVLIVLFLAASLVAGVVANRYVHLEQDYTDLALKVDHIVAAGHAPSPPTSARNPLFAGSVTSASPTLDSPTTGRPTASPAAAPSALPQSPPSRDITAPSTKMPAPVQQASSPMANRTVLLPASTLKTFAVSTPAPVFPSTGLTGADATVDVQATLSIYGMVKTVRILRGNAELGAVAARTMRTWQFRPYLVDGKPVEVIAGFTFHADAR